MKNKFLFILIGLALIPQVCFSGAWGLTHNSRANCYNNESISWDGTRSRDLAVTSIHYYIKGNPNGYTHKPKHTVRTGALFNVNRAAAIHVGEGAAIGIKLWYVVGHHWEKVNRYRSIYRRSASINCDLTNGWF